MKLKKVGFVVCVVVSFVVLASCGNKVTQKELIDNKWSVVFEESKDSEVALIADFTKEQMILSLDASKVESDASNEFEALGEELAKNIIGNINYKVDYKLNGKTIHLQCDELDLDNDFDVKKEKDKVIFANQKTNIEMTLTPLKEDSDKKPTTEKSSVSEESKDSSSDSTVDSTDMATGESSAKNVSSDLIGKEITTDQLKLKITGVDFLGNVPSIQKEIYSSEGLAVIYYTVENLGVENFEPHLTVIDHFIVSEEDDVSDDVLSPSFELFEYDKFKKLDKDSRLNIKQGATINGAMDYSFSSKDKSINIKLVKEPSYKVDNESDNIVAQQTFTKEEIKKSFEENKKIKPSE